MKKSVVLSIHIIFWVALLATVFINRVAIYFLDAGEFGTVLYYSGLLAPVFFYLGYLGVMGIRWSRKTLFPSLLAIVSAYVLLYIISEKAFAYALVPVPKLIAWISIGCLFRFAIDWFRKRNELMLLEKTNVESNLALLKTQINPHFLFNTLHNIDALIHDNQAKASESLVKLSDMMRYMLGDAKSDFVEVSKEVEHLENYLSLERLRLKNEKFLNYSVTGEYRGMMIAPMMMIPFVENAFKHSVDSVLENGIIIDIRIENRKLSFVCENHYDKFEAEKDKMHGIGLETVKKRLDLIYKNRYRLSIHPEDTVFKVHLEIELNEN